MGSACQSAKSIGIEPNPNLPGKVVQVNGLLCLDVPRQKDKLSTNVIKNFEALVKNGTSTELSEHPKLESNKIGKDTSG